jgi:CubicO group peptidase (beta-lactamase class C family)
LCVSTIWSFSHERLQQLYKKHPTSNTLGRIATEEIFLKKAKRELSLLLDTPEQRYLKLFTEQPNVIRQIPLKYIASYIGITPQGWVTLTMGKGPAAASGLRLTSRGMAKLGLLYLNGGRWNNRQLLDSAWVAESVRTHITRPKTAGPGGGYGYQFWTYSATVGPQTYPISAAVGNGGQRIFICQPLNLVVVMTAGNYNQNTRHTTFEALTTYILPAVR